MPIKTFTSTVLSSADVNTYLMNQTVITCTSGTRPASPLLGMFIYETDTDTLRYWNGAGWFAPNSRLGSASRTTASGAITTEAMLGLLNQVSFTLTAQRRVRWEFKVPFDTPSTANVTPGINLRRNATGAVVALTDTQVMAVRGYMSTNQTNPAATLVASGSDLLAAGTYAYGLGASCSGGSGQCGAAATVPATLEVYDAGWL